MSYLKAIYKKESNSYLNSSIALVFLGTFLIFTLITFFVVDKFFERDIADVRPLFHWLPVLLIFLVSALTMRSWAEERTQGTLELLLTWPIQTLKLVLGKFFGVMVLVALALALTFPLPITVEYFGDLDWGPVIGGYLGALLVASAYAAIGLWVSSFTGNQIVALFLTAIISGMFYAIGSDTLIALVPNRVAEVLAALGTGARFESIARGVIDVRDVIYYLSITAFFGGLNVFSLTSERWSKASTGELKPHHKHAVVALVLIFTNLLALNLWLAPLNALRLDLTARQEYSISKTTKTLLRSLQEPLTIRFYYTETHPLLKPLLPQVRDLIKEYAIVAKGNVRAEFIDPTQNEEAETEAAQDYGIRPVPFQVPSRHEMKILNSYFDILVLYGDQHLALNFGDLIEVKVSGNNNVEVKLRNLEYDLTRSIKKTVYGFQGIEELFANLSDQLNAKVYYTSKTLSGTPLAEVPQLMEQVYGDVQKRSQGKFSFELVDLDQRGNALSRKELFEEHGIKPIMLSLFSQETYLLHTLLTHGQEKEVIYPSGELNEKAIRDGVLGFLKRNAKGYIKTVGLWTPPPEAPQYPQGFGRPPQPRGDTFRLLNEVLGSEYKIKSPDLASGGVDRDVDVLFLVKPKNFDEKHLFAVDQFLMQGGTVIVASGAYEMNPSPGGGISVRPLSGGIGELTKHYGIEIERDLVLDVQNEYFPIPVTRYLGNIPVQEIKLVPYPFFVNLRQSNMAKGHPALSGLNEVTLNWASSLKLDEQKEKAGQLQVLARSSNESWIQASTDIQPNFKAYPEIGFNVPDEFKQNVLIASVQASSEQPIVSYFSGKISPLSKEKAKEEKKEGFKESDLKPSEYDQIISSSKASARLIVVSSGDFITDNVLGLSRNSGQERYINSLQLAQNLIDWSLEDIDLLSIRSRGSYARTLDPKKRDKFVLWETGNYLAVLFMLAAIAFWIRFKRGKVRPIVSGGHGGQGEAVRSEEKEKAA